MADTQRKARYDSLEYANELKNAGFTDEQSGIQARALFKVINQELVTGQDLKELETKVRSDVKDLETKVSSDMKDLETKVSIDMKDLEASLNSKIMHLETKVSSDMKNLETKVSSDMKDLETKIREVELKLSHKIQEVRRDMAGMGKDIIIKLGTLMASLFAVSGVLITVVLRFSH